MIDIRPVDTSHLPQLARVYADSYNSVHIGETWDAKSALALMNYFYKEQPDLFFAAFVDEKIAGATVAMVKPWWDGNHLIDGEIFVDPQFQKKGLGEKLLRVLFEKAQEKYQAVSWDTYTHIIHEHPLSWYKKLGFEQISNWTMITGDIKKVLKNIQNKK